MKTLMLALLMFGCGSILSHAQGVQNSVPDAVSTTVEQVQHDANPLFVAETVAREQSLFDTDTFLRHYEGRSDFGNAGQIVQKGDDNVTFLQQYGTQNVASIRLEGNDNIVDATQGGNQNVLGVSVLGSGNHLPIAQRGTGNELSLELVNVNDLHLNPPIGIEQTGGGVPVIIQITSTP